MRQESVKNNIIGRITTINSEATRSIEKQLREKPAFQQDRDSRQDVIYHKPEDDNNKRM